MNTILLIILFMSLGAMLQRLEWIPSKTPQLLNSFVIYISYPALVLLTVPVMEFNTNLLGIAAIHWLVLLVSVSLVLLLSKLFKWENNVLGALLLIVPLGNTSFLGFPMVQAFFGEQAVSYALIYDQLGSFLALAIYGSFILVLFSNHQEQFSIVTVLKKVVVFPPFIAMICSTLLHFVNLPNIYFEVLKPFALSLIPLVMIAVGMQLKLKVNVNQLNPFIVGLTLKMIAAPLFVMLLVFALDLTGVIFQVTVFEAAMPPMITAGVLAIQANLAPRLTAAMVAYGILLSFLTLPLLHYILR